MLIHIYMYISTYLIAPTYKQGNTYIYFALACSKISNTKELQSLVRIIINEITLTITWLLKFRNTKFNSMY